MRHELVTRPCRTPDELHAWVRLFCGLNVPRIATCPAHDAPFEYLRRAYFEPASDLVIWAPRGGGKTRLAAVATLLDLLHKPGTSVRVLGGSLEQSMKMWDYLLPDLLRIAGKLLKDKPREGTKRISLINGSNAAVLTQSERAVRGLRVQKLRCDEVELFDERIWEAAQLTTKTGTHAIGAVEAASTFHRSGGLMAKIVESAKRRGVPVVQWCLADVLAACPDERKCEGCGLYDECRSVAKRTGRTGFISIDDALRMKGRVSSETWDAEMLCRRPTTRGQVFPTFDESVHVRPMSGWDYETMLGIDFGFAAPFVCLWIASFEKGKRLHVYDEYVQPGRTLPEHVQQIIARRHAVKRVFCDPAGAAINGHTAASDVAVLRSAGFRVSHRPSRIVAGLELIRRRLKPATGQPRLFIDPKCVKLIAALRSYRYPETGGELPIKDGTHDHPLDALRYALVNLECGAMPVRVRAY